MTIEQPQKSSYRIGAVARLTGVSVETLRVWERRYRVVTPQRSEGGSRLYGEADVEKLVLIKRLVDAGHAIGTVAGLTLGQLESRSAGGQEIDAMMGGDRSSSIVIVGSMLPHKLTVSAGRDEDAEDEIEIAATFETLADFEAVANKAGADALVVEVPVVIEETVAQLRRLQQLGYVRRLVVVYDYGKTRSINQLESQGAIALRNPVNWSDLTRLFKSSAALRSNATAVLQKAIEAREPAPARQFDDRQLSLISSYSSSIECECQRHLADLVVSLSRFEVYSVECENRSERDAILHSYVHSASAHARSVLESALGKVIEEDGFTFDPGEAGGDGEASPTDRFRHQSVR